MAVLRESPQGSARSSSGENYDPLRIVLDGAGVRVETIGPNGIRVGWKERAWRAFLAGRARAGRLFVTGRKQASRIGSHATTTLLPSAGALIRREPFTRLRWLGGRARFSGKRVFAGAYSMVLARRPMVRQASRTFALVLSGAAAQLLWRVQFSLVTAWPLLRAGAGLVGRGARAAARHCVILLLVCLHALIIAAQISGRSLLLVAVQTRSLVHPRIQAAQAQPAGYIPGPYPIYPQRPLQAGRGFSAFSAAFVPLAASAVVALLAVHFYGSVLPGIFGGLRPADVPTLTSRTLEEATEAARIQGLSVTVAAVRPSDSSPKNVVVEQVPAPGTRMRRGDAVKLTVSAGLRPPSVIGKPLDQARVQLVRDGWSVAPEVETRMVNGPSGVVIEQQPGPDEAQPEKTPVKLVVAATNLAQGRSVQKSGGGSADQAVDGQPETVAWIPGAFPNWVEIDFGGAVNVTSLSLLLAQERPGPSVIEVWAWDTYNRFAPLQLFSQETSDNMTLSARLPQSATNVVRLRVVTTTAPSSIGWREITVSDR